MPKAAKPIPCPDGRGVLVSFGLLVLFIATIGACLLIDHRRAALNPPHQLTISIGPIDLGMAPQGLTDIQCHSIGTSMQVLLSDLPEFAGKDISYKCEGRS